MAVICVCVCVCRGMLVSVFMSHHSQTSFLFVIRSNDKMIGWPSLSLGAVVFTDNERR